MQSKHHAVEQKSAMDDPAVSDGIHKSDTTVLQGARSHHLFLPVAQGLMSEDRSSRNRIAVVGLSRD
jgi:hypothetical protein